MERLEGETLATRLGRDGRLELPTVALLVSQIAGALANAHELGVVHRDVKPENVFLCETDDPLFVKVIDFGVAKARDDEPSTATDAGALLGTPHYMSPEQLLDATTIDHRADLWALGVVAYHALTGERPFRGSSPAALSTAICTGRFRLVTELCPALPTALDAWFARALSVTIEDRFSRATELKRAFADAAGDAADRPVVEGTPRPPAVETPLGSTLGGTQSAFPGSVARSRRMRAVTVAALAAGGCWLAGRLYKL